MSLINKTTNTKLNDMLSTSTPPGGFDTQTLSEHKQVDRISAQDEFEMNNQNFIHRDSSKVDYHTTDRSSFNPLNQLGDIKSTKWVEQQLLKLRPNFIFYECFQDAGKELRRKKLFIYNSTTGKADFLFLYVSPFMPEYSILHVQESYKYLPKSDLPKRRDNKGNLVPTVTKDCIGPNGEDLTKYIVYDPWGEKIRGWRKLVQLLVRRGIITSQEANSVFGNSQRAEWKFYVEGNSSADPWLGS